MKVYELLDKEEFLQLRGEIHQFAETILNDYIHNISPRQLSSESKEIFDPIWGPVEFNAGEILILDAPLIQRLRKIKQLGLASYVYCGADYSRFAHTIGVFKLSGEMAEIISRQLPKEKDNSYDFVQIVRLAAIFHDAGHMYFCHASERYFTENTKYSQYNRIKSVIDPFSKAIDNNVALHEIISVMLVNSPAVKTLLLKVAGALGFQSTEEYITEIVEYISCLILGQANNKHLLPYHQIISGPLDADKCDYLSRDSHATNVPVAVDIFRLIHKLSVHKGLLPEELPNTKLWEDDKNAEVYYPTIRASALEAFNQLLMARSIMYNSVYYHQKVRTAETMLAQVLEGFDALGVTAVSDFMQMMFMTDDTFGHYCFNVLVQNQPHINQDKLRKETDLLNKINQRMLLKRACSIDLDQMIASEEKKYRIERDIFMLSDQQKIREIERETKVQLEEICRILGIKEQGERTLMIMEFPKRRSGDSFPNIFVSYGNGTVKNYSEIFQTGTWIESKESRNKQKYMVTDCENRELAFLALQKALFLKYEICLKEDAAVCSKVAVDEIKSRKRRLLSKGFYKNAMALTADIILPDFHKEIEAICKKYQTYEGTKGIIITESAVNDFIMQFLQLELSEEECRSLLDGVLRLLKAGIYINREYFGQKMGKMFQRLATNNECLHVCPLGKETDSGVHMTYYLNDLPDNLNIHTHMTLQDALQESYAGEHIVLFDDGAYSGKQATSIFEEYMGVPLEKRIIKETHVKTLSDKEKEMLMDRKISLAYICLNTQNEQTIMDDAQKAGMHIDRIEHSDDMEEKKLSSKCTCFKDEAQRKLVYQWMKEIGLQILTSVKKSGNVFHEGWSEERVEKSALGYNDAQQVVILKSSVPTYTITAFWLEGGVFQGNLWKPLFVRTSKSEKHERESVNE